MSDEWCGACGKLIWTLGPDGEELCPECAGKPHRNWWWPYLWIGWIVGFVTGSCLGYLLWRLADAD